jgi:hypothetical protein
MAATLVLLRPVSDGKQRADRSVGRTHLAASEQVSEYSFDLGHSFGQCPVEWWTLRVDPRCLLAAVDRGEETSIAGGFEEGHRPFGEIAAFA